MSRPSDRCQSRARGVRPFTRLTNAANVSTCVLVLAVGGACNRAPDAGVGGPSGSTPASDAGASPVGSTVPAVTLAPFPAPHGPRLFVSNEASGDLSVIDVGTNAVVATIPIGKRPRGVQRSPDGAFVYVALSGSVAAGPDAKGPVAPPDRSADAIGIIDTRSGAQVGRLPSGTDPEQFSVSIDGATLFISNEDAALVSIVGVSSKSVEASIPVGEEPEGMATSPDGHWVYATCESAGAVEVIDPKKHVVVKEIKVGARPRAAAFLPNSSKAYVTSELGGTLTVISLPNHEISKTLKLGGDGVRPMGIAISPDGTRAYVTTGHGGTVVVVDTAKDEIVGSIAVGKRPWGVAVSPDGKTIYTANGPSDDVSVVDTASAKETARIHVGSRPWGVVLIP